MESIHLSAAAETPIAIIGPGDYAEMLDVEPPAEGSHALVIGSSDPQAYGVVGTTGELREFLAVAVTLLPAAPPVGVCAIEAFGTLTAAEFHHIMTGILGRPPERHKDGAEHYVFTDLTTAQAAQVTAYLRTLAVAHTLETTTRWPLETDGTP